MDRTAMYIDMDAYFASVEQASRPSLCGKPIAVAGSGKRTVIVASSYEAKRLGIKTGMTKGEALKILPSLVIVEGRNSKYTDTCVGVYEIILKYTPDVEIHSIDEFFADFTRSLSLFPSLPEVAGMIKEEIERRFNITCSVGIGPNKLVAKMAGESGKPNGLVMIKKDEVRKFMEDLPIEDIPGIGRKMKGALNDLGIRTCGDLADFSVSILRRRFGIWGDYLSLMARGIEPSSSGMPHDIPKSIGHSMTFEKDIGDRVMIRARILELAEMVAVRLRREGLTARGFSLTWRYPDFSTFTKRITMPFYTQDGKVIWNVIADLMDSLRLKDAVRLLGITAFRLKHSTPVTPLIAGIDRTQKLYEAMDRINDIFGEYSILRATMLLCTKHHWVISPSYRPHKSYPYRTG
jgi:DNA polymerase-4